MQIIGCDLHARQQTIAMLDTDTGELVEKVIEHEGEKVREFYSALDGQVLVGIEATRLITKSSAGEDSHGRSAVVPVQGCLISTTVTRSLQKEDYGCPVIVGEMKIRSARARSTARGRSLDMRDFAT